MPMFIKFLPHHWLIRNVHRRVFVQVGSVNVCVHVFLYICAHLLKSHLLYRVFCLYLQFLQKLYEMYKNIYSELTVYQHEGFCAVYIYI